MSIPHGTQFLTGSAYPYSYRDPPSLSPHPGMAGLSDSVKEWLSGAAGDASVSALSTPQGQAMVATIATVSAEAVSQVAAEKFMKLLLPALLLGGAVGYYMGKKKRGA